MDDSADLLLSISQGITSVCTGKKLMTLLATNRLSSCGSRIVMSDTLESNFCKLTDITEGLVNQRGRTRFT